VTTPFILLALFVLLALLLWYCVRPERIGLAVLFLVLIMWCLLELGWRTGHFFTHFLERACWLFLG
jgi:hypothetical protein